MNLFVTASHSHAAPGSTIELAYEFSIDDGWHTYAPAQNDTGLSARADWTASAGHQPAFSGFRWPAAERYTQPGDILDHVYEHHVVALQAITVPTTVKPGEMLTLTGEIEWLVCDNEQCLPEWQTVEVAVQIAEESTPSSQAGVFDAARDAFAVPLHDDDSAPVSARWVARNTLEISGPEGAVLSFIPFDSSPRVQDLLTTGSSESGTLRLVFEGDPNEAAGWITLRDGDGPTGSWVFGSEVGGSAEADSTDEPSRQSERE
ncbi:MAG: protein-disulfide reductase DsbD domain-containing protein [Planctomycetota bacterium]